MALHRSHTSTFCAPCVQYSVPSALLLCCFRFLCRLCRFRITTRFLLTSGTLLAISASETKRTHAMKRIPEPKACAEEIWGRIALSVNLQKRDRVEVKNQRESEFASKYNIIFSFMTHIYIRLAY